MHFSKPLDPGELLASLVCMRGRCNTALQPRAGAKRRCQRCAAKSRVLWAKKPHLALLPQTLAGIDHDSKMAEANVKYGEAVGIT